MNNKLTAEQAENIYLNHKKEYNLSEMGDNLVGFMIAERLELLAETKENVRNSLHNITSQISALKKYAVANGIDISN